MTDYFIMDSLDNERSAQCWETGPEGTRCIVNHFSDWDPIDFKLQPSHQVSVLEAYAAIPKGQPGHIPDISKMRWRKHPLNAGEYHPRIYRDLLGCTTDAIVHGKWFPSDNRVYRQAAAQITVLNENLERICRYVEPTAANLKTFGHEIRNHLILACTEVEAQFVGIINANVGGMGTTHYSLQHFIKLLPMMRLSEFSIKMFMFTELPDLSPFCSWTGSLAPAWWTAYNKVKHNREDCFHLATLEHALQATAACTIMMAAQYGHARIPKGPYLLTSTPEWLPMERYIPANELVERKKADLLA